NLEPRIARLPQGWASPAFDRTRLRRPPRLEKLNVSNLQNAASQVRNIQDAIHADRRSALKLGMLGLGGLTLSNLLRLEDAAASSGADAKRANSVIVLHMRGGPSQLETW